MGNIKLPIEEFDFHVDRKDFSKKKVNENGYMCNKEYRGCLFLESYLHGTLYEGCTFLNCMFDRARLNSVVFLNCRFVRCTMESARLKDVFFLTCDFTKGLVLDGSVMTNVVFKQGVLKGLSDKNVIVRK